MKNDILCAIADLCTYFDTEAGVVKAVDGVSFTIYKGEVLGIVGESGSGKSVTGLSMIKLIPQPPGRIVNGSVIFNGVDLLKLSWPQIRKYRGKEIAFIFQEPMTSLNPVFKIGMQMKEIVVYHQKLTSGEAHKRCIEMLTNVGIPNAEMRLNDYPHQFSGGMRQRVMIAMALLNNPSLLIADEPTTALDVTIQAQIIDLMVSMKKLRGDASIMLITHNLAVVAETCDRVIVMYGGKIQECALVRDIFKNTLHPYTKGLLNSIPRPDQPKKERLQAINGMVPHFLEMPLGCKFCTRCPEVLEKCKTIEPELKEVEHDHFVRCHLY